MKQIQKLFIVISVLVLTSCGKQEKSINLVCNGTETVIQILGSKGSEFQEKRKASHTYSLSFQERGVLTEKDGIEQESKKNLWSILIDGKELLFEKDTLKKSNDYQGEITSVDVTEKLIKVTSESRFHPISKSISNEDVNKLKIEIDRLSGNWKTIIGWYSFMTKNGVSMIETQTGSTSEIEGQCSKVKENKI